MQKYINKFSVTENLAYYLFKEYRTPQKTMIWPEAMVQ